MEPTTRLHNSSAHAILQEAYVVFHHPITLHPTDGMFETDGDGRDHAIVCVLRWGKFTPPWLFLRLDDRDLVPQKALESPILREVTPAWESLTGQLREACVMCLTFHGLTQEAAVTGRIDDPQVLAGVTLLLAAVVVLLGLWIDGARDRSLRALRPNRGGIGTPAVRLAASLTAQSSALRAGSNS